MCNIISIIYETIINRIVFRLLYTIDVLSFIYENQFLYFVPVNFLPVIASLSIPDT